VSNPYVGEIRQFGFNFAPRGWALCQGQILSISQNTALFSLLGTYYGGNGTSTFGLPNLQGAVPLSQGQLTGGSDYVIGETGGSTTITLLLNNLPIHAHTIGATSSAGREGTPTPTSVLGDPQRGLPPPYYTPPNTTMAPTSVGFYGSSQPHNNIMPTMGMNYCIALTGVFPSRS
jgi:microcystin-dependent protein